MISNEDRSAGGNLLHQSIRSKGAMATVKVGSRNLPVYPLVVVSLALLDAILLLTAIVIGVYCGKVAEDTAPQLEQAEPLFAEFHQLQLIVSEANNAKREAEKSLHQELTRQQQLKLDLELNKTHSDNLERQIEALHVEQATLQSTLSDLLESCGRCPPGWFLSKGSCYYHGKSHSLKNWRQSRADCISRGADLAVIDTLEKQLSIVDHLPKLTSNRLGWKVSAGIWIGLTDIQTEGTWVWVNNVTLNEGHWLIGEPSRHLAALAEDCAALLIRPTTTRNSWFSGNCFLNKEWLCEMSASS